MVKNVVEWKGGEKMQTLGDGLAVDDGCLSNIAATPGEDGEELSHLETMPTQGRGEEAIARLLTLIAPRVEAEDLYKSRKVLHDGH